MNTTSNYWSSCFPYILHTNVKIDALGETEPDSFKPN